MRLLRPLAPLVIALFALVPAAQAADRATLRAFLEVTGFDVAIASLQQGAMAGPAIAGDDPNAFGTEWVRLAEEIFDPEEMIDQALDMMEVVMPDELVNHGAAFYASDLGQKLVVAENASHMADDEEKFAEAEEIVTALVEEQSPLIDLYRRMGDAIGGADVAVRSAIEIQVRYLMAAMRAGVSDIDMSEQDLREILSEQSDVIRENIEIYGILGSAYTYRDFTLDEVIEYTEALEDPRMRQVYEILNAIQFEVMAARYEQLAAALAGLAPQQDI